MEYMVVSSRLVVTLETKVTEMIKSGWSPTGGLAADSESLYQAMIRVPSEVGNGKNK